MKLLIILSIEEYTDEVRKILARQKVTIYSETEVYGFRTGEHQPDIPSWFAKGEHGVYSKLFFSIQDEGCVSRILDEIESYKTKREDDTNPIHAFQLEVEKAV